MKAQQSLEALVGHAIAFGVKDTSDVVLFDPRFILWSGSSKPEQHHYGKGGLVIHTAEVVDLALRNNAFFPPEKQVDRKHLFLAALFHDAGKMWDYKPVVEGYYDSWTSTVHKRQIHHISRSGLVWSKAHDQHRPEGVVHDDVLHAILAHHGQRDWGSPVSPNTRLAIMLHLCDNMSARMDDIDKIDRHS